MEILFGVPFSVQEADHIIAPGIGDRRKGKLFDIAPVFGVAGIIKVFGAEIGVQTVGEGIVQGADMTAGAAVGLQHGDIVAAPDKLVGAGQAGNAGAHDDYLLFGAGSLRLGESAGSQRGPAPLQYVASFHGRIHMRVTSAIRE